VATRRRWLPGRFLVDLSRHYLEPRLVAGLAARVRRGETVDVGGLQASGDGGDAGVLGCLRHVQGQGLLRWRTGG
jgi:hypothetical protein